MNVSPSKEGDDAADHSDCSTVKINRIELTECSSNDSGEEENHSSNETKKRQRKRIELRMYSDYENQEEEDIPVDNLQQDTRLVATENAIEAKRVFKTVSSDQNEKGPMFLPHITATSTIAISSDEEQDTTKDTEDADLFKTLDGDDESNDNTKILGNIEEGNR